MVLIPGRIPGCCKRCVRAGGPDGFDSSKRLASLGCIGGGEKPSCDRTKRDRTATTSGSRAWASLSHPFPARGLLLVPRGLSEPVHTAQRTPQERCAPNDDGVTPARRGRRRVPPSGNLPLRNEGGASRRDANRLPLNLRRAPETQIKSHRIVVPIITSRTLEASCRSPSGLRHEQRDDVPETLHTSAPPSDSR